MRQHTFTAAESTCKQTKSVKSQLQLQIRNAKPCLMLDDRLRKEMKVLMGLGNCSIWLPPLILQRCVYSWGMHEKNIILKRAVGFQHRGLNVIAPHQHMYNCRHIICKHVVHFIQQLVQNIKHRAAQTWHVPESLTKCYHIDKTNVLKVLCNKW